MKVYCAMLDSFASEQAARVIAMQAATENADNLIGELTLQYNKLRQQAITNEILDLAAGAQNQ
jgi:F-type H+-transporting ATPase subunit gamma